MAEKAEEFACSDEDWKPPTEAEMKVIKAKRERSDKISKLMGDYLLKGYTMLNTTCPNCTTILLKSKQGVKYCVACSELNSDTDKDDPALSSSAAEKVAAEQHQRATPRVVQNGGVGAQIKREPVTNVTSSRDSAGALPKRTRRSEANGSVNQPRDLTESQFVSQFVDSVYRRVQPQMGSGDDSRLNINRLNTSSSALNSSARAPNSSAHTLNTPGASNVNPSPSYYSDTVEVLEQKLLWATEQLKQCSAVEYSIQLCQLINTCAQTLEVLRRA